MTGPERSICRREPRSPVVVSSSHSPSAQIFLSVPSGSQERELEGPTSERPSERIQGDKVGVGGAELGSEREQVRAAYATCSVPSPLSSQAP